MLIADPMSFSLCFVTLDSRVIVPGFWEGSAPFNYVASILESQGYATNIVNLPSTGTESPGNPGMTDDIAAMRSTVTNTVINGEEIVLVLHSAGGFLGSNAIEGLALQARQNQGLKGGVRKVVFLTGAVFPEGYKHSPLPFFTYDVSCQWPDLSPAGLIIATANYWRHCQGGALHCVTPETTFFNDLDEGAAQKWVKELKSQPSTGWDNTVTYCGWREVPSVYLMCESDACIPLPMQMHMAVTAGSKTETCAAGHMPIVSMPERVVNVIRVAAMEV